MVDRLQWPKSVRQSGRGTKLLEGRLTVVSCWKTTIGTVFSSVAHKDSMNHSCGIETEYNLVAKRYPELLVFLCVVNAVLAIIATVGNSLVLAALWRTPSLRSPTYVLLSGLALSDLGVGLIGQPTFVGFIIVHMQRNCHLFYQLLNIYLFIGSVLSHVTFLTLCAVTFERFLALKIYLRYRELVTVRQTLLLLGSIWIGALVETVWFLKHPSTAEIFSVACTVLLAFSTLWCYFKIFQIVRHHQSQIQSQAQISQLYSGGQNSMLNIARYRKSIRSMQYIFSLFLISYLPWVCFHLINRTTKKRDTSNLLLFQEFLVTLTYLNSFLNPFLYCWRMGEIRQAVKETIAVLF